MRFERAEDDLNTMMFHRHASKEGVEIGIYAVLFGFRVRAGIIGQSWLALDYCGGADQEEVERIYSACLAILEKQDKINWNIFPRQARKPMRSDPECMAELDRLAGPHKHIKLIPLEAIRALSLLGPLEASKASTKPEQMDSTAEIAPLMERRKAITPRIREIVSKVMGSEPKDGDDLGEFGADSLDHVEIVMEVEKAFGVRIPDSRAIELKSVNDFADCLIMDYSLG